MSAYERFPIRRCLLLPGLVGLAVLLSGCTATPTITADTPDPSTPGQAVTVAVTVKGTQTINGQPQQGVAPSGSVTVSGADANCTLTLVNGSGACTVSFAAAGSYILAAAYGGDGTYPASLTNTQHAVKYNTTTAIQLYGSGAKAYGGAPLDLLLTVTAAGRDQRSSYYPTGTVVVTGASKNCTANLTPGSNGGGRCYVTFAAPGTYKLQAVYSGDNLSQPSSSELTVVVGMVDSTLRIGSDRTTARPGQTVHLSATVLSGQGGVPVTGSVTITGPEVGCTITLAPSNTSLTGSVAIGSCDIVFQTPSTYPLSAKYSGDQNVRPSATTLTQVVAKSATSTYFYPIAPEPSNPGQPVTVRVYVVPPRQGDPAPSGTVNISGADAPCTITLAAGEGSCSVSFRQGGNKTLTATYQGDSAYEPSQATKVHTVSLPTATPMPTPTPLPTDTPVPPEPPPPPPPTACGPGTGHECPP